MDYSPPLPKAVIDVLERTSLCYLATSEEDGQPHLSLMNFAVLREVDGIALVLSTQKSSKKWTAICANPKVALLMHDFDGLKRSDAAVDVGDERKCDHYISGTYSVTVYGRAELAEGRLLELSKQAHLAANKSYAHFIEGPDIAVFVVRPTLARMANVHDKVETWEKDGKPAGAPVACVAREGCT
jgi:general stress protein 26